MKLPVLRPDLAAYGKLAVQKHNHYVAGQIEVTSKCFQHCLGCDSWREELAGVSAGEWSLQQLQRTASQLLMHRNFEHLSLTGGDPQAWAPLDDFLDYWASVRKAFNYKADLQLNTALTQDLSEAQRLRWRTAVADLRVSLDGVTQGTYEKIRGRGMPRKGERGLPGNVTSPASVIQRMVELQHPGLTTNTTVFMENIHEVKDILRELNELYASGVLKIRKAHFLAVIGDRGGDLNAKYFWQNWEELRAYAATLTLPTSVSENPHEVRRFLRTIEAQDIKCWAGNLTFHAKCDGWVYPCCLVGGEALKTQQAFRLGNAWEEDINQICARYEPTAHYCDESKPCASICQWKQLQLNVAGHLAENRKLAMP